VDADGAHGPGQAPVLQVSGDLGREGGEGGEPAQEAGDDQQLPFRGQAHVLAKEAQRHADEIATQQVGDQRAGRDGGKQGIEPLAQQPAQAGAGAGSGRDGKQLLDHPTILQVHLHAQLDDAG